MKQKRTVRIGQKLAHISLRMSKHHARRLKPTSVFVAAWNDRAYFVNAGGQFERI